ncbi:S8 family serine peptidase [Catellatospora citrea]|uniref:Type VII secretion-associated serine protease n=1 Tax=Catellatospora citrea TaxID=53366 RepID=A0A8J3KLB4_9ACTN|nr:S8 family serine peptidase [Catellatospora citrea]RKE09416.1 type VII secretion-associated serine protease mycosin [Catellatospora citrea]GIF97374.1 type VII secretion-associated serine protease [Catellatospora citrea]
MRFAARLAAVSLLAAVTTVGMGSAAHADRYRDDQWYLPFLRVAEAHAISQGEGVTVAVIDSGVEGKHPDLTGNVLKGFDTIVGGDGDGWGDDEGHGSSMAGLIAGHGHGAGNKDGVLGMAPKAKVLPIRISTAKGHGGGDAIAIGIDEAVKRGVKIISISESAPSADSSVLIKAVERAHAAGVLVLAAAGNQPKDFYVAAPGRYPGAVAVGAVDQQGTVAPVSVRGDEVQLVAPGVDITSTSRINTATNTQYRRSSGTSPATAITAGLAALVWSKYPQLTADEVLERMTRTAVDKGPAGRDRDYGFGLIDPVAALTAPAAAPSAPVIAPSIEVSLPEIPDLPDTRGAGSGLLLGVGLLVVLLIGGVLVVVAVVVFLVLRKRR